MCQFKGRCKYTIIYADGLLLGQFFSGVHVRVLRLVERAFQVLELIAGERGPAAALFAFQMETRFGFRVRIVGAARAYIIKHIK